MISIKEKISDKDDNIAYKNTKKIVSESQKSNKYYECIDELVLLLNNQKSYIRTRAFIIICSQAKWDNEDKIKKVLPKMLVLLHDEKPTVVRQCLNAIKEVVIYKPDLKAKILNETNKIELSAYKDSMKPLIKKDIEELVSIVDKKVKIIEQNIKNG